MNPTRISRAMVAVLVCTAASLLIATVPAKAAAVPSGKTYFIVALGLSPAATYQLGPTCLSFTPGEVCEVNGACGPWQRLPEKPRKRMQSPFGFQFDLIDDESGLPITIQGVGRFDGSGVKSSIGAVGHAIEPSSGTVLNFSIAGRAVRPARCEQLVNDFEAELASRGIR